MGLFRSLAGLVVVRITSADLSGILSQISVRNIQLLRVEWSDDLICQATVYQIDCGIIEKLVKTRGDKIEIIRKIGVYWGARSLLRRPVLVFGTIIFLLIALYMPSRILFVNVKGNSVIPANKILEAADNCGISFFASRREIRSEKIKNVLLEQIPELQWVGVNTAGCVATISVTEKSAADQKKTDNAVGSIIASRDGVIKECTVTRGEPVCRVGQAVKAGQVLVSGYTDCGIAIKATRAEAEIYAQTLRDLEVITPVNAVQRGQVISTKTIFSVLIGKKLINLFKDSGISDAGCVKMYKEYYLTLPGGFQLPLGLLRQTRIYYSDQTETTPQENTYLWLTNSAEDYLCRQMIAGQILSQDRSVSVQNGVCILEGQYACLEMIGQFKREEFIQR